MKIKLFKGNGFFLMELFMKVNLKTISQMELVKEKKRIIISILKNGFVII